MANNAAHDDDDITTTSNTAAERGLTVVDQPGMPVRPANPLQLNWTPEDMEALKQTVAKECSGPQFKVFVAAARRLGLDPFARQIVPIVQGGRMTPQTTIDGFRLIAERTRLYGGQIGPFWCGADGAWVDVWLADSDPVAAKVGVIRRDFSEPMWGVARTKAYRQPSSPVWSKMPDVMIAKVAESLALRKAFPQELSGVYTREEMAQAESDDPRNLPDATPAAAKSQQMATAETTSQKGMRVLGQTCWDHLLTHVAGTTDISQLTADMRAVIRSYVDDMEDARLHKQFPPELPARMAAAAAADTGAQPADDATGADEWQDYTEADAPDAPDAPDAAADVAAVNETPAEDTVNDMAPSVDHAATRPPTDAQLREIAKLCKWLKLPDTLTANSEAHARAIILELNQQWAAHVNAESRAKKLAAARRAEAAAEASLEHLPPMGGRH